MLSARTVAEREMVNESKLVLLFYVVHNLPGNLPVVVTPVSE